MKKMNAKVTKKSLLLGIPFTAAVATLSAIAPSHATGLFDGFGNSGKLLIDPVGVCFARNAVDFKTVNSADPCSNNEFGLLGKFEVTGATGGFAPTNPKFANLFGSIGDISDLIAPGLDLPLGGNGLILGLPAPNLLRFDLDAEFIPDGMGGMMQNPDFGVINKGDMVFDATEVFVTEMADAVTLNFTGSFKEIASISDYNTIDEVITYVPGQEVESDVAVISGGFGGSITDLSTVGNLSMDPTAGCSIGLGATTPNIIVDPNPATNPCVGEFDGAAVKDFTSTDGVFQATVPEPSNIVGLLAAGTMVATTFGKGKQKKQ